jgi:DNA-binding CsgD family transcriptional regulator
LGWALLLQGVTDHQHGEQVRARVHYEEALGFFRELSYKRAIAVTDFFLGLLLFYGQGDALTARSFLEEATRFSREAGFTLGMAVSLLRSAEVALLGQGDLVVAYGLAEEALGFFRELSYKGGMAEALFVLARVQARQGSYSAARSRYADILTLAREGDDPRNIHIAYRVEHSRYLPGRPSENDDQLNIPFYLEGLAEVVAAQGEGARAARLWGAAEAMREEIHAPLPAVFRTEYERAVTATRTQLGEQAFAEAMVQGRAMTPEQALAAQGRAALSLPAPPPLVVPLAAPATSPAGLTAREMDVLRLLTQGLTSAQIAEQLVIGLVTVNAHVRSIYSKLGVTSRAAATRYALEHHLL